MTFTSPTSPIALQEGTFTFSYIASGSIKAGQCLKACGTMQAIAAGAGADNFIGVAYYDADDGDQVAVLGPGNIVRVIVSGSSKCTTGDDLYCASEGKVWNVSGSNWTKGKIGVALETKSTSGDTVRVQLI